MKINSPIIYTVEHMSYGLAPSRQFLLSAGESVFFMPGELYRPKVAAGTAEQ